MALKTLDDLRRQLALPEPKALSRSTATTPQAQDELGKRRMSVERATKLVEEALAIEAEEAIKAGALGFMARVLVQATLPHSKQTANEFRRTNGLFTLTVLSPSHVGLPYGSIPRLLLSWLTTEAVRKKTPVLELGDSVVQFLRHLGITSATGGKNGSITRARNHMIRLFSSSISCTVSGENSLLLRNVNVVSQARLWWDPKSPDQLAFFNSSVTLGHEFFQELIERPVPIDLRALTALKHSPLCLDIYCWLTYRMSYLSRPTTIPWAALQLQFGSDYSDTRFFKRKFKQRLTEVLQVYRRARVKAEDDTGLLLLPSPPHVDRRALRS